MATDSTGTKSVTNTLTGTTADTIRLQQPFGKVEIYNHSETVNLFARFDGTAAVADANECEIIAPGEAKTFKVLVGPTTASGCNPVSVVGNGQVYTVTGMADQ